MLNRRTGPQTEAFLEGLHRIIGDQFGLFLPDELQLLITGGVEADIDIDDLRRNTIYHGFHD